MRPNTHTEPQPGDAKESRASDDDAVLRYQALAPPVTKRCGCGEVHSWLDYRVQILDNLLLDELLGSTVKSEK